MTVESWIASYFESLNKPDSAIGKSEALALKCSNFPKALFRYRSVERLAYCLEELRDGYVFLNNPDAFNDPYDSALSTSLERFFSQALEPYGYGDPSTVSEFIESIDKEAKEHLHMEGKLFQNSFLYFFSSLIRMRYGMNPQDQDLFSALRNVVRVSCFTTNSNSVVMWSHYAKQHTGICIEFSGSSMVASAEFFELVHPVRYAEKLFDFTQVFSFSAPEADAEYGPVLAACHKSKEWEYENEWRLVSTDPKRQKEPKFSLNACGIKPGRIILGARIDQADRAAIEDVARKISVPVVQAKLAKDRFAIELEASTKSYHSFEFLIFITLYLNVTIFCCFGYLPPIFSAA